MWQPYQVLLPLLSLFLVRVDLTDLFPLEYQARIIKVIDGDTVLVKYGNHLEKLRFSRIDAPEKGQLFFHSQRDAGAWALACARQVLNKKLYSLKIEKRDIYGRLLGDLDEVSLGLVRAGCVTLYPHAVFSSRREKYQFLLSLKQARAQKKGLWKYGGFLQPKLWRKKFNRRVSHRR